MINTVVGVSLAISIPQVFLPGIGACIRTSFLAKAKLISRLILVNLDNLVPALIASSYCVQAGPTVTATTLPITPNSLRTVSNILIFFSILA